MTAGEVLRLQDAVRQHGEGPGAVRALDGISCTITRGERVAVVGPSGSGKTTLLSVMGLLEPLTAGTLTFAGEPVHRLGDDAVADLRRDNIGFVFQLFHLIPALSALDNVCVPLVPFAPRSRIEPRARTLLDRMGVAHRLHHRPWQLSGGEQQRVAIARALINRPHLVLADEPTGNLDTTTAADVIDTLTTAQAQDGFTLIIATHDPGLAASQHRQLRLLDGTLTDATLHTRPPPVRLVP